MISAICFWVHSRSSRSQAGITGTFFYRKPGGCCVLWHNPRPLARTRKWYACWLKKHNLWVLLLLQIIPYGFHINYKEWHMVLLAVCVVRVNAWVICTDPAPGNRRGPSLNYLLGSHPASFSWTYTHSLLHLHMAFGCANHHRSRVCPV